jgi:acetone carboxylase gamma subunit
MDDKLRELADYWTSEAARIAEVERATPWYAVILDGRRADYRQATRLALTQCANDLRKLLDNERAKKTGESTPESS